MPARRSFTVRAFASTTTSRQLISLRRRAISAAGGTFFSRSSSNFQRPFIAANVMSNAPPDRRDISSDFSITSNVSALTRTGLLAGGLVDADDVALRLAGAFPVGHQDLDAPDLVVAGREGAVGGGLVRPSTPTA